ncbi:MAG TPA: hypothetical protein VGB17_16505 [Pyrinomonadaceae bacterium]|jgi:hypothetical protein
MQADPLTLARFMEPLEPVEFKSIVDTSRFSTKYPPVILNQRLLPQTMPLIQPVATQLSVSPDFWGTLLRELRIAIEEKWKTGSPNSYAIFKIGEFLSASPRVVPWVKDVGVIAQILGMIGGLNDVEKAIDRHRRAKPSKTKKE